MDAATALAQLVEVSTQVVDAVVTSGGAVDAATAGDERGARLAAAGRDLLTAAAAVRPGVEPERVAVELPGGALLVIRAGERALVARTVPGPTLELVAYDMRQALAAIDAAPARRPRRKRADA